MTAYSKDDYAGMRTFVSPDDKVGFALKGDDIVSLFKNPSSDAQGVTRTALALATQQGGRRLDAFDTVLPHLYSASGFRTVARLAWNDRYAPPGWSKDTFKAFNGGRPDVVFMVHAPGSAPYRPGDGARVADYDAGTAAQRAALDRQKHESLVVWLRKYNEEHDALGRFTGPGATNGGGATSTLSDAETTAAHSLTGAAIVKAAGPRKANSVKLEAVATELSQRSGDILQKQFGVRQITKSEPKTDEFLARAIAKDLKEQLDAGHANPQWYHETMAKAMEHATAMHPELKSDKTANFAYRVALSITSQGETVTRGTNITENAYAQFHNSGKFPEDVRTKAPSIKENFEKMNKMFATWGPERTEQFFNKKMTQAEFKEATGKDVSGILKTEPVYGSAILGPKIGLGFYQNVSGNFEPYTFDRWFMRTWGRLTNTGMQRDETALAGKLTSALKAEGKTVPTTPAGLRTAAVAIVKQHERDYKDHRAEFDAGTRTKSVLTNAAVRYVMSPMVEQPRGGAQRKWMGQVLDRARAILATQGVKLDGAGAQAALWHPEQRLWKAMGARVKETDRNFATALGDIRAGRGKKWESWVMKQRKQATEADPTADHHLEDPYLYRDPIDVGDEDQPDEPDEMTPEQIQTMVERIGRFMGWKK